MRNAHGMLMALAISGAAGLLGNSAFADDAPFIPAPAAGVEIPSPPVPGTPDGPSLREAAACGDDFRLDGPGQSLEHVPIRDQSSVPNCYANASAVMMVAWGLSHEPPRGYRNRSHRASPYWGSVRATEGDRIDQNLEYLRRAGSCDQASLLSSAERGDLDGMLAYQIRFNQAWPSLKMAWDMAHEPGHPERRRVRLPYYCSLKQSLFPHSTEVTLSVVSEAVHESSVDGMIQKLFSAACEGHMEHPDIPEPVRAFHPSAQDDVARDIGNYFDSHRDDRQPVGIGLCGEALLDKDYVGFSRGAGMQEFLTSDKCHVHAVAVIGRRWNAAKTRCEFLLRNSWGTDCTRFANMGDRIQCENGELWVSSSLLNKSVLDTITMGQ